MNQAGPMISLADVYKARQVLICHLATTPLLYAAGLSRATGCEVYIKYENLSPIRSFKARGAIYFVSRLPPEKGGIVCASTGNHGQGVALAGRLFGRKVVVVVPVTTTEKKMRAIQELGAELRIMGQGFAASSNIARQIARDENLVFLEDGEEPDVMIGCATLALEVVEQLPEFQRMIIPVGGGNLIAACALVAKIVQPAAIVTGVQAEGAAAVYHSWKAGQPQRTERSETFAGGLDTTYPGSFTFPYILRYVDEMVLVGDEALRQAARQMLAETGHLPEGAGAAGLAALLADPARYAGQKTVIVLSGGNFEPELQAKS
ncbi:MAG: pyridoxal-phosphate dependent enzyme [Chloroflexi bacterium]|nr:pyridoxal-phosphate dependent enzyme [Chloroflexota bacterium]